MAIADPVSKTSQPAALPGVGRALVMAGNAYLADRAHKAGASHISIVPTVVDADAYGRQLGGLPQSNPRSRIGWIGTPSTWHQYMVPMLPMLKDLALKHYAIVRVVGATVASDDVIEVLPWSESEESEMIQGMDVGLMPLDDSPWARGKCGYKIIQYMACGIPVVASPVGVNADIVQHGVTGFLASTDAEWREAIETLLGDSGLRQRMGEAGRRRMEEHYSLQTWAPRVAALLKEAAQGA